MSGSIRWFVYRQDNDESFALRADESNTKFANDGGALDPPTAGFDTLPRGVKPRYALYVDPTKRVQRKCYVLTGAQLSTLPVTMTVTIPDNGNFTLNLVSVVGEKRTFINPADTGLNDGTP